MRKVRQVDGDFDGIGQRCAGTCSDSLEVVEDLADLLFDIIGTDNARRSVDRAGIWPETNIRFTGSNCL